MSFQRERPSLRSQIESSEEFRNSLVSPQLQKPIDIGPFGASIVHEWMWLGASLFTRVFAGIQETFLGLSNRAVDATRALSVPREQDATDGRVAGQYIGQHTGFAPVKWNTRL